MVRVTEIETPHEAHATVAFPLLDRNHEIATKIAYKTPLRMLRLGIRFKLFLGSLALIGLAVVAAEVYLSTALERQLTERISSDLAVRARLLAERVLSSSLSLNDEK